MSADQKGDPQEEKYQVAQGKRAEYADAVVNSTSKKKIVVEFRGHDTDIEDLPRPKPFPWVARWGGNFFAPAKRRRKGKHEV